MSNNINIRTALIAGISPLIAAYPAKWPNRGIMKNGQPYTPNNEPWLRCTILMGADDQIGLAKTDRINGILQTDVFVPKGSGDLAAIQLCDAIRAQMPINGEAFSSGGVSVRFEFHALTTSQEEATWYRQSIESRFYAYVDRTV